MQTFKEISTIHKIHDVLSKIQIWTHHFWILLSCKYLVRTHPEELHVYKISKAYVSYNNLSWRRYLKQKILDIYIECNYSNWLQDLKMSGCRIQTRSSYGWVITTFKPWMSTYNFQQIQKLIPHHFTQWLKLSYSRYRHHDNMLVT